MMISRLGQVGAAFATASLVVLVSATCVLAFSVSVLEPVGGGIAGGGLAELPVLLPPMAFAIVGALLVWRLPHNPIGWMLAAYGVNFAATVFAESYVHVSSSRAEPSFGVELAGWFQTWNWALGLVLLANLLLHFPSGHLPSRGWRWYRRASVVLAMGVIVAWVAVWPVRFDPTLVVDTSAYPPLAKRVQAAVEFPVMLLVLGGLISLFFRFRRAGRDERLQLKWLFLAAGGVVGGLLSFAVTDSGPGRGAPLIAEVLTLIGLSGVPVAIGIAVLRYRLYDIDRLIGRTVSYLVLMAVLAGVYVGGVLGLGSLVPGGSSDLVVAASTLAVAALFQPARQRVQALVDRRFYRARYDAQRVAAVFAGRLRSQFELERLRGELGDVVVTTLGPRSASIWMRPEESS